ncbi:MAG: hypothetical protein KatS3mg129_0445 [Leptospiraceae bacterium]|nr:MAG: hypothetical protein KatS3mg129_0445 [Leptospiraceae bacterium]
MKNNTLFIFLKENQIQLQYQLYNINFKSKILSKNIEHILIFIKILNYLKMPFNEIIINHKKLIDYFKDYDMSIILNENLLIPEISLNKEIQYLSFRAYTLTFLKNKDRMLLGKKKRGFGKEYYNGFGGKVKKEETILMAAKREIYEECHLIPNRLIYTGKLYFTFKNSENPDIEGYVFYCTDFSGNPEETEEMKPLWFSIPEYITSNNIDKLFYSIPFDKMWEDDIYWFPYMLNQNFFKGFFTLNEENKLISFIMEIYDYPLIPECNSST